MTTWPDAGHASPWPWSSTIGRRAALTLSLIEDHEEANMRLYTLSASGKNAEVALTGEELRSLSETWTQEEARAFTLKGVKLP